MASAGTPPAETLAGRPAGEALALLVESAGPKVFGLGMKLCGSRDDAEDLVQETFLQAYRKWDQFEGRSDPSTWLYTIAVRVCRRRRRRRSGEPKRIESLAELLPSGEARVPALQASGGDAFERLREQEAAAAVDRALAGLPLAFRLPLVLKEIAELSVAEIAAILGIKPATVKTRVHRGRLALRKELVAALPGREAPPADHPRQVCMDLLRGKMEALDRGVVFPVPEEELCSRCKALFDSLDLTTQACRWIEDGTLPEDLRQRLLREIARLSG